VSGSGDADTGRPILVSGDGDGLTLVGVEQWCARMRAAGAPDDAAVMGELTPERAWRGFIRGEVPTGTRPVLRLTGYPRASTGKTEGF
jgi:hypothetical protein